MSGHQSYQLYAHITWHTWRRVGCINSHGAADIEVAVKKACAHSRVRCLRLAVVADHVHLLISYHPTTRISDFIRLCKSGASYRAGRRVPGAIKWCRGYHVSSVGKRELRRVEAYIANQHEHHSDLIPKARSR